MSAPDTNLDKQKKRHAGPLVGITAGLVFAAILLFAYLTFVATPEDDSPDATPTGEAVQTDGNATIEDADAATDQNPNSDPED